MRKYKLNEKFFETIDTEEKAYFLGFLFADGYINESLFMVDLTLHQQDTDILKTFINHIYYEDRPLKIIRHRYVRLVISSKKLIYDLKSWGCFQKKTFDLKFPSDIPQSMIKHFIRGYFDGDGCVTIDKQNTLNISIVGTIEMLMEIKNQLILNCQVTDTVLDNRFPSRNNNIRALRYGGNIIINRIYHYLYDNSTIFLNRKKNKFLDILENKTYFYDTNKIRSLKKHAYNYSGQILNQNQLAKILSIETGDTIGSIRRKLQRNYSIEKIKNINT